MALAASVLEPAAVASVSLLDISPCAIPVATSESSRVLEVLLEAPARAESRRAMRDALVGRGLSGGLSDWLSAICAAVHIRPARDDNAV